MNSIYHRLACVNVVQYCNTFTVKLSECFVILHYKLIIAQGSTMSVQDTT